MFSGISSIKEFSPLGRILAQQPHLKGHKMPNPTLNPELQRFRDVNGDLPELVYALADDIHDFSGRLAGADVPAADANTAGALATQLRRLLSEARQVTNQLAAVADVHGAQRRRSLGESLADPERRADTRLWSASVPPMPRKAELTTDSRFTAVGEPLALQPATDVSHPDQIPAAQPPQEAPSQASVPEPLDTAPLVPQEPQQSVPAPQAPSRPLSQPEPPQAA